MKNNDIREPIQKRSIEKKEKIIQAGFDLICKKGYHNTNTAEIAKAAGVSTGIVYSYFQDKHNILIEGLKRYSDNIFFPQINIDTLNFSKNNLDEFLKKIVDDFIENHKLSQTAHEEIMTMTHSDKEIAHFFHKKEMELTLQLSNILIKNNFQKENLTEKVHICIGLIDNICHEIIYHQHEELNYTIMKNEIIKIITNILK